MTDVDKYVEEVIKKGDSGSAFLAAQCAPTLRNNEHVKILSEGMNGFSVLRVPKGYSVYVHGAAGDPKIKDTNKHASSMVERLVAHAHELDATPVGMANVIDASQGDRETIEAASYGMKFVANRYGIAIMNGELAILGNRVNCPANVSGTMISIKKGSVEDGADEFSDRTPYAFFDPRGEAVYINSDGIGTKTEFYERADQYPKGLRDSLAMKLDDASKRGAKVRAVIDVVESKGRVPIRLLNREAANLGKEMNSTYLLIHEDVGNRLLGWNPDAATYNVSGSAVSTIDENMLENPLKPHHGDFIMAIRGKPNPRSNGITDKRKVMARQFGNEWQRTKIGHKFLEFLAEPSTVFYPVFSELIEKGVATSVYHMSGGAYDGKLAAPLAKHGMYARLVDLFEPDWRELALAGFALTSAEDAYRKWPMGNEAFITTRDPASAARVIHKYCLETRTVGQVYSAPDGKTGIEFTAANGATIHFPGKKG